MSLDSASRSLLNPADLFVVHSEASSGWGGQENRVFCELLAFQKLGSRVALVAPSSSMIFSRCAAAGIPVHHASFERRHFIPELLRLTRWLRVNRPDVVNTHSSRDGWCMAMASRLARTPLLIRSRHIDVGYKTPAISRHAFTSLADHVITTSDSITQSLQKILGVKKNRISTIATGVDCSRFNPRGGKADLPRNRPGPLIGMVSVLRSWKGHAVFFEAIRELAAKNFAANYVVVGGGAPLERFRSLAEEHEVGHLVHFTGHREDIPEVLRALDLLVIPSTAHEGIPQIGLQALACGTPTIGSNVGGIPEIIQNNRTGRIFAAKDPAALASTLVSAFGAPDQTRAFALNGMQIAVDEYSVETMTRRLLGLYSQYLPHRFSNTGSPQSPQLS